MCFCIFIYEYKNTVSLSYLLTLLSSCTMLSRLSTPRLVAARVAGSARSMATNAVDRKTTPVHAHHVAAGAHDSMAAPPPADLPWPNKLALSIRRRPPPPPPRTLFAPAPSSPSGCSVHQYGSLSSPTKPRGASWVLGDPEREDPLFTSPYLYPEQRRLEVALRMRRQKAGIAEWEVLSPMAPRDKRRSAGGTTAEPSSPA